jgi:hypothetical protein
MILCDREAELAMDQKRPSEPATIQPRRGGRS